MGIMIHDCMARVLLLWINDISVCSGPSGSMSAVHMDIISKRNWKMHGTIL